MPGKLAVDKSRRAFIQHAGVGLGGLGALGLLGCSGGGKDDDQAEAAAADSASGSSATTTQPEPELEPSEYLWTGARCLFVTVPIAAVGGAPWLPPGLTLTDPPTATFFVARYPLTAFRSVYNEAAVLLHVTDSYGNARHCPWMVVDDDTALIYGRELLGYPKKLAEISLTETDDSIVGVVTRHDTEILRLEAQRADLTAEEGPVWSADRTVNVHGSVIGGMRLLDFPPLPEEVHERSVGTATVTAGKTDRDPIADLEPGGEGSAIWGVMDFAKLDMVPRLTEPPVPFDWAYGMSIFSIRIQ
jgi:acetoacetate decarboxylase